MISAQPEHRLLQSFRRNGSRGLLTLINREVRMTILRLCAICTA